MEIKNLFFRSKNVQYKITGSGKSMMLIHGYQADSRIWDSLIPLLSEQYRLIIPDLPGHGKTDLIQQINSMDFLAEVVYRICYTEGITNLSLIGHSLGGYVALSFAQKYTQYVENITLISAHPFEDSMPQVLARTRETELLEQGKKNLLLMSYAKKNFSSNENPFIKEQKEKAVKIALEQSEEGMMADLSGMMARNDLSAVLLNNSFPVKIIYGLDDTKMPSEKLSEFQTSSIIIIGIENCGHLCLVEKPDQIAKLILS